jgi:excisionase family DNA binding protein
MAATKTKAAKKPAKARVDKNGVLVPAEPPDVLTLAEAAAYLRVAEADLIDAASAHDLPGRQVGGAWRFLKSSLRDWLNSPPKKTGNEALLALAGCWKDDPYLDEMLEEIYKQRGQPMIEEKE